MIYANIKINMNTRHKDKLFIGAKQVNDTYTKGQIDKQKNRQICIQKTDILLFLDLIELFNA